MIKQREEELQRAEAQRVKDAQECAMREAERQRKRVDDEERRRAKEESDIVLTS